MDLLDLVSKGLGRDFATRVANLTGESAPVSQCALDSALTLLLAGLARKAATPEGAGDVLGLLDRHGTDPAQLANLAGLLSGNNLNSLASAGTTILAGLFGERTQDIHGALGSLSGIRPGSAATLLSVATPLALGLLRHHASREGLGASGLASLLQAQQEMLARRLPDGLARSAGWGDPADWFGAGHRAQVDGHRRDGPLRRLPWLRSLFLR